MVAADPQLAWLKQVEQRGDVDWRRVKEIHDSFKYSHSGLGAGAQLAIAVFIAAVVGPMAIEALGSVGGSAATSLATAGTISTVNNKGNLGAVLKETFSGDSLKNAAVAGVTAGLTENFYDGVLKTKTNPVTGKVTVDLSSLEGIGCFAGNQMLQDGTSAVLNKALGRDVDFKDALQTALFNTIAAAAFNAVGDHTKDALADGSPGKVAIHALVGGLLSEATGGDFTSGALAAGANEALIEDLNALVKGNETLLQVSVARVVFSRYPGGIYAILMALLVKLMAGKML
ncbi:filamentous hemagglutinin [Metapseudomonas otitidis]|nr:filamentous hemagglutinin [Pseudomonas otitidis]